MADLWILVVAASLATYLWRALGVVLSGRLHVESELFNWIACVAYAMIAGLIARIVLMPSGVLAATALPDRVIACAIALVVYRVTRRNLFAGVGSGVLVMVIFVLARE